MKFDWYGASVEGSTDELLGGLVGHYDLASVRHCRPLYGYERGAEVHRGERVLASVFWGGVNNDPFVQGTGDEAPALASYLRGNAVPHRVARADVAEDYTAPGAFDQLTGIALAIADRYSIKVRHEGDWHRGEEGRTLYFGGKASAVQVCTYEKGKQLRADPNWTRVELRVRPHGAGKVTAASAEPQHLWGASRWSAALAESLGAPDVQRMALGTVYRPEDSQRAREALIRQYGPTLRSWATELGGYPQLGLALQHHLEEPAS